jgi:hypothetical protein
MPGSCTVRERLADQAAMAAPPIVVFDPAGNFIKTWGGAGTGYEWVEGEHGIHIDHKGFAWLGGIIAPGSSSPDSSRLPMTNC